MAVSGVKKVDESQPKTVENVKIGELESDRSALVVFLKYTKR